MFRSPSFSSEVAFGSSACFGLSAGRDVSRLLGIELTWTQANPAQRFVGPPPTPIREITMNIFELDSLWYFGRGMFRGYGILGVGGSNTGSSFGGASFTAILGVGFRAFFDRHFAIRGDVKFEDMYGNVGKRGAAAFCDSNGCYYYRRSWYSSLIVTGGLTYAF